MIVIDDDAALEALDTVCTPNSSERILSGAYLAIIRAWEKEAQREPFAEMLDHCVHLYNLMARIRFLAATKALLEQGPILPENLDKSLAILTVQAESHRTKLLDHMKAVRKIPARGVTKH